MDPRRAHLLGEGSVCAVGRWLVVDDSAVGAHGRDGLEGVAFVAARAEDGAVTRAKAEAVEEVEEEEEEEEEEEGMGGDQWARAACQFSISGGKAAKK